MVRLLRQPVALDYIRDFGVFSDFEDYVSGDKFTAVAVDDNATVARHTGANNVGGVVLLSSTGDNNEQAYLHSSEIFKFIDGCGQVEAFARIATVETTANTGNFIFGLMDAIADDVIVDDSSAVSIVTKASYTGAVFYKKDGGTNWVCESSLGTARSVNTTDVNMAANSAYETFLIRATLTSSTNVNVTFHIDPNGGSNWQQCKDSTTNKIFSQDIALTGSETEMSVFCGFKAGADEATSMLADYMGAVQLRNVTDTTT